MKTAAKPVTNDNQTIHFLPRWVTFASGQDTETVAFCSGAALALLDLVLRDPGGTLPGALLRDRMALQAAVACLKLEGRNDSAADIRDAVCLARPVRLERAGDALGPAGDMFMAWRKLVRITLKHAGWRGRLTKLLPGPVAEAMQSSKPLCGSPIAQAGQILEVVLRQFPRQEAAALMLADVTLARCVGWERPVPLLAAQLARREVRAIADGESDPVLFVHRAMSAACDAVIRSAADLARRAEKLRVVAPKLRAKGSDEALDLFLSHDALMPAALPLMDRAARRLCDRLVELGVVRELTGRPTFRLYGL